MKILERYDDPDMTVEQYHALGLPYLSHSMIRLCAAQGSWVFYHTYVTKELAREEDTDATRLGTIFHYAEEHGGDWQNGLYIVPSKLEDDRFLDLVSNVYAGSKLSVSLDVGTDVNLHSPAHRQYVGRHRTEAAAQKRLWCIADEAEQIKRQVDAVFDNPAAREIIERSDAIRERAHFARTATPIILKALIDVRFPIGLAADFKTTRHTTTHAIVRDAINKGYIYQAAHYQAVAAVNDFLFIVVTKSPRPECLVFEPLHVDLDTAATENQKMYDAFALALEMDSWHSPGWGGRIPLTKEGLPI